MGPLRPDRAVKNRRATGRSDRFLLASGKWGGEGMAVGPAMPFGPEATPCKGSSTRARCLAALVAGRSYRRVRTGATTTAARSCGDERQGREMFSIRSPLEYEDEIAIIRAGSRRFPMSTPKGSA